MPPRAQTPPMGERVAIPITPEHVKSMAENRLKAKAALQERERAARSAVQSSSALNANAKRPLQVIPSTTTSSNAIPSTSTAHFQRDDPSVPLKNMIGSFVDYDLATLKNSRGGFLLESEEDDPRRIKEARLMEENKKKRLETMRKQGLLHEPPRSMNPEENPKCVHCKSMELDLQMRAVFKVFVCGKCKGERPDEYSLLTKTECREDYLLTEPELKDDELLPHLLKPNPHRPTYSNMMLFLRLQVEAYAFSEAKWGSPEALDAEFERREEEKRIKKGKKFDKQLKELRKKTKTNVWHKRVEGEHKHVFGEGGRDVQRCEECGFEVEVEVF